MAVKKTSINLDFDLWLKAYPELRKRGFNMTTFFHLSLEEFLKKVELSKKRGSNDKESGNSPKQ